MEGAVATALEEATQSVMEKQMGCVIVYRRRIIASSANYTVGTLTCDRLHNISMHSEMAAIEQLAKSMGYLQTLHRILSGQGLVRQRAKVRHENGPRCCKAL